MNAKSFLYALSFITCVSVLSLPAPVSASSFGADIPTNIPAEDTLSDPPDYPENSVPSDSDSILIDTLPSEDSEALGDIPQESLDVDKIPEDMGLIKVPNSEETEEVSLPDDITPIQKEPSLDTNFMEENPVGNSDIPDSLNPSEDRNPIKNTESDEDMNLWDDTGILPSSIEEPELTFFTKNFEDYTVTEGLLLLVFVILFVNFVLI